MGLVMDKITKIVLVGWRKRDIIGKLGNHLESVASGGLAWRIIVKVFLRIRGIWLALSRLGHHMTKWRVLWSIVNTCL